MNRMILRSIFESKKKKLRNGVHKCYELMKQFASKEADRSRREARVKRRLFKMLLRKQKEKSHAVLNHFIKIYKSSKATFELRNKLVRRLVRALEAKEG